MKEVSRTAQRLLKKYASSEIDLEHYKPHGTTLSEKELHQIKRVSYGELFGMQVWAINGEPIRDSIDLDFTTGGNPARYTYVPENELWVEYFFKPADFAGSLMHEFIECKLMEKKKMSYDKAHDKTNTYETKLRKAFVQHKIEVHTYHEAMIVVREWIKKFPELKKLL
jgi:hypothetical protein